MRELSSSLLQWDSPVLIILVLAIGIGMVATMYLQGGMSATAPFNYIGLAGFLLIAYVIVKGGIVDKVREEPHKLSIRMFRSARERILIFSGQLHSNAYLVPLGKEGGETMVDALLDKAMRGVRIRIITERDPDPNTFRAFQDKAQQRNEEVVKQNLKFFQLTSPATIPREHFTVVDDSWVRVEEEHARDQQNRRNREVRGSLYLSALLGREFAFLSEQARETPW